VVGGDRSALLAGPACEAAGGGSIVWTGPAACLRHRMPGGMGRSPTLRGSPPCPIRARLYVPPSGPSRSPNRHGDPMKNLVALLALGAALTCATAVAADRPDPLVKAHLETAGTPY